MMKEIIFDIQQFSIHDGPGIRTTVFFKGCNLNCIWCHNPESISYKPQLMFDEQKCIACGVCFDKCNYDVHIYDNNKHIINREKCMHCNACIKYCYAEALTMSGRYESIDDIIENIKKDETLYIKSNGGVTFSGGEPLLKIEFLLQLLKRCKKLGYHTAVDTAGNVDFKDFEKILDYTDLFLYDIKCVDEVKHKKFTGVLNKKILSNLKLLSELDKDILVRIPLVPNVNDNEEEIIKIGKFLKSIRIKNVEILPFHKMGSGKYRQLNIDYKANELPLIDDKQIEKFRLILKDML